ncbi:MAG: UDP-N-acetylmuramate dehydrogenase [Muribaculaceae bacterium]|nr:UDP-N-acetylmuramate dehydrogenase [Muribaculaceae bacterium]
MITEIPYFNIKAFNTFGMDVKCRRWIDYTEAKDLPVIFASMGDNPYRCIGAGSNMLFTGDYDGTLLHSSILDFDMEPVGNGAVRLIVGSGVEFDSVIRRAAEAGLWGIENLSAIPGDAGAAAVQNIGAYGVEIKDVLEAVECYDVLENRFVTVQAADCGYAYRYSMFKEPENRMRYIVTGIRILLSKNGSPKLEYGNLSAALSSRGHDITPLDVRNEIISVRHEKLPEPAEVGSAGSFFKNPVVSGEIFASIELVAENEHGPHTKVPHFVTAHGIKIPAAWLIEQCGLKGASRGNAAVWHKQPLVLVNATGKALPEEILALENEIRESVRNKFGITLYAEVDHI